MELELNELTKYYKDLKAVNGITLTLNNGVNALLGPNGSGKTTLLRLLCGILKADHGTIQLDGMNVLKQYDEYVEQLGYMPQHFGYYASFSVEEFLNYMAVAKGLKQTFAKKRIEELLEQLNLAEKRKVKMKKLSGGMLRRVGIAQALLNDPKVLILDEPTAGLDPKERMALKNLISMLAEERIIIFSTHIVSDVEDIANRILVLNKGTIFKDIDSETVFEELTGKVWEVVCDKTTLQHLRKNYRIISMHSHSSQYFVRLFAEEKPQEQANKAIPDLNDYYLYCFPEEGDTK